MLVANPELRQVLAVAVAALWASQSVAVEQLDLSGNVGYTYRALQGSADSDTTSNQLRGAINARSYIYRPWFARVAAGLRATLDSTDFDGGGTSNDTTILTGDLDLNVLPQSRSPFSLIYRVSDSRVDLVSLASPLTTLGDKEFQSHRLELKQSYFNEQGDRFQARYDRNRWSAREGDSFREELWGLEMDMRRPKHTLTARTSYQETERNVLDKQTETSILNVDHFYHPSRALRLDSMVSYFDSETTSDQPLHSTNQGDSATDLGQLSSFVFWRPYQRPLTMSAGIRFFDLTGKTVGNTTNQMSVSASGGLFYQLTKNLRLDANLQVSTNDNEEERTTASKARAGALYQSDVHEIFSGLTYQWHASGAGQSQDTGRQSTRSVDLQLGHDAQRLWLTEGRGTFRFSVSQNANTTEQSGDADSSIQSLDHSGSLSWDRASGGGTTMLQVTVADSRSFGDQETDQQFANFQALRNQTLSRRSSLSGNLTVQSVSRDFNGQGDNDTVTATGQINYRHTGILRVPRLRFQSDLRLSKAATDDGVDRTEWENRLDYAIGLLNTSLSWRYIALDGELNDEDFSIIYFQVDRHF